MVTFMNYLRMDLEQFTLCILLIITSQVMSIYGTPPKNYQQQNENTSRKMCKRQVECIPVLQDEPSPIIGNFNNGLSPLLTEEEKKRRQVRMFEGLLQFATVVNHVDTFLMDKGKLFLKSLGRMVESEEDNRFKI